MRIGIGHENSGAAQYQQRCVTPSVGLRKLGHRVNLSGFTFHGDVITLASIPDERVWRMLQPWIDEPIPANVPEIPAVKPPPDVMVLRLFDQADPDSTVEARKAGQLVFFDLDDDVWNIPEWNGVRRWIKRSGEYVFPLEHRPEDKVRSIDLDCMEANYAVCDGVLCSTPRVLDAVREAVPGATTFLCRNGLDWSQYIWPRPVLEHEPRLRVAWMGVTSAKNAAGFSDVLPALAPLLEEYHCELWHLGHEPGSTAPPITELLPDNWTVPVRQVPWAKVKVLPWLLSEIDIGIIARRKHVFHEAQSNVSGLSYAAAGVPFVVSATDEYRLLEMQGAGVTFTHPNLTDALEPILASAERRAELRQSGRRAVVQFYNPRATALQWQAAFEEARRAAS